jgi:hypothetical protein
MPRLCDFCLIVSGPEADLRRFQVAVDKHAEQIAKDGWLRGWLVVSLDSETWGKLESHDFFWADPRHPRRPDLGAGIALASAGPTYFKDGRLRIDGTAKWAAPCEFIERASALFPALAFELRGWTENELYEHWVARQGVARLVEEKHVNPQTDEITRWVKDGKVIVGEDGFSWLLLWSGSSWVWIWWGDPRP